MSGKLSIGGYGNPSRVITIARQVGGRVILLADGALDAAGQTGAVLEIGRVSIEHQAVDSRFAEFAGQPIGRTLEEATRLGTAFAQRLVSCYSAVQVWQLSNEGQGDQSPERFRLLAAFELAGTRELHRLGRQSCVLNLGVGCGQPEDYALVFGDLLAEADYCGLHAYGSPERQLMQGGDAIWYALRYRQIVATLQALGKRCPPIVLTECTTYNPWRGKYSPQQIANDLVWLGTQMEHDPYVVGCCGFQVGHPDPERWGGFDLDDSAILDVMASWNSVHPARAWTEAVEGKMIYQVGQGFSRAESLIGPWRENEIYHAPGTPHETSLAIGERGYATWRKATNETVAHCDTGEIYSDHGNRGDGTLKRIHPKA